LIIGGRVFNPGELRTSIVLERRDVSTETGGFKKPNWSAITTVKAKWINAHGNESRQAAIQDVASPATVLIRYQAGLDTTCAVSKDGVRYEIVSVDDIQERHEYMELIVRRMKAG